MMLRVESGSGMDVEEIGDLYYDRIYKLAFFHLRNGEEAEDLTQEVFLKILRKQDTFAGRSDTYSWIYRLAVNTILNHIKRKNIVRFISFQDAEKKPEGGPGGDADQDPARRMELKESQQERLRVLERGLDRMSPRERTAFFLFHYENMKQKEIAGIMATTVPAVESLIHKAKKKVLQQRI